SLIAEGGNVKEGRILDAADAGYHVEPVLTLNPRAFAPEVRKLTSKLFAAVKAGEWTLTEDGDVRFDAVVLD
ncbi:Isoleucine-tRNA ligase, partial [human gut metagenome]